MAHVVDDVSPHTPTCFDRCIQSHRCSEALWHPSLSLPSALPVLPPPTSAGTLLQAADLELRAKEAEALQGRVKEMTEELEGLKKEQARLERELDEERRAREKATSRADEAEEESARKVRGVGENEAQEDSARILRL